MWCSCYNSSFGLTLSRTRTHTCHRVSFHPHLHLRLCIQSKLKDADQAASFYDLLGIPETGSLPEIKQAYKQLARKYHPDVSPPDRVEEYTHTFIRLRQAYETLSDPKMRALYDRDRDRGRGANGLRFALSPRRRYSTHQPIMEEKSEWKSIWQSQLSELKRRSMSNKDSHDNKSWGARMRTLNRHQTSS